MEHVTTRTPAQANYLFGLARADLALARWGEDPSALSLLAEGYALQGRFSEAADLEPDVEKAGEYTARAVAIAHAGSFQCECPPVTVKPSRRDAKGERSPTRHAIEEVFDGERTFRISKCLACGALSAEAAG
jgi:hypothetical protein